MVEESKVRKELEERICEGCGATLPKWGKSCGMPCPYCGTTQECV